MGLDNPRIAILALVVSICLCSLILLYFNSRPGKAVSPSKTVVTTPAAAVRKNGSMPAVPLPGAAVGSGTAVTSASQAREYGVSGVLPAGNAPVSTKSPVSDGPPPLEMTSAQPDIPPVRLTPDTMVQLEEKAGRLRDHRRKVLEASESWLREKLDDENLTGKTKEVYRLRLLPGMKDGIGLLQANDYTGALRAFEKALEDPDATPVSKHLIYDYMLQAAGKMKDRMLYASMFKAQAVLQRDHDLSVLGLDKSNQAAEYAEYMTDHLKAANDEATFNKIVERDMKSIGASSADREKIVADVKERIREFEGFFDDRKS